MAALPRNLDLSKAYATVSSSPALKVYAARFKAVSLTLSLNRLKHRESIRTTVS